MNILQVNTHDFHGGAARVASALHAGLRGAGHGSRMLVGVKSSDDPDVIALSGGAGPLHAALRVGRFLAGKAEEATGLQYFLGASAGRLLGMDAVKRADVIHLHNTHGGYLNLWAVEGLSRKKPVLWTLHDMWPITGHCAHSLDCERWKTGCGSCPSLKTYPPICVDTTRMLWRIKERAFRGADIAVTAPSRWLRGKLPESILAHVPAYLVPNAVDTDIFRPGDKRTLRARLGLPQDRFIAIFVADKGGLNPWKGYNHLMEALSMVGGASGPAPYLVVVGGPPSVGAAALEARFVGETRDARVIADHNAASDAYLAPSIAENSPLAVLEAMASGTPVVAFNVGGLPELLRHRETGYLALYRDAADFARGIKWLMDLSDAERKEAGARCAAFVRDGHALRDQVAGFLDLYEVLAGRRRKPAHRAAGRAAEKAPAAGRPSRPGKAR